MRKILFQIFILFFLSSHAESKEYWAAIAVNEKLGLVSTIVDVSSMNEAHRVTINNCQRKKGGKCIVAVSFANQCGAAAWSPKTKTVRAALHDTSHLIAAKKAQQRCNKLENDPNCKILANFCTSWETNEVIWW